MRDGRIRVGIIGTEFGAAVHLPAFTLLPECDVVALCGRDIMKAERIAARARVPYAFDDYRDLIAHPDVDAISVAAPPELHHAIAIAAIGAGKPVLCETPMAHTANEAREMSRMAETTGVIAMVAFAHRFYPNRAYLKELIASGFIGVPTLIQATCLTHPAPDTGGVLGTLGAPYIDALRWWCGEIAEVAGAVTDAAGIMLRFASGALGTLTLSQTAWHGPGEEVRIFGPDGMLVLTPDGAVWGARNDGLAPAHLPIPDDLWGSGMPEIDADPPAHPLVPSFIRLARVWVNGIRTRTNPAPSFVDGQRAQEVIDAVTRSQQQHKWVDVSGARWPLAAAR